jgi:hypothetical protein
VEEVNTMAKIVHSALVALNIRKSDKNYRWYYYHHI